MDSYNSEHPCCSRSLAESKSYVELASNVQSYHSDRTFQSRSQSRNPLSHYITNCIPSSFSTLNFPTFGRHNAPVDFQRLDGEVSSLKKVIKNASDNLDESGYQSVLMRSQHSQIGTGWLMYDHDKGSRESLSSADDWDGYMTVGGEKVKIKEISELLTSRYAFLSGVKTPDGQSLLTFPDIRHPLSFPDYKRLVTYLLQVPPLEDAYLGYVVIIDRRCDKWTSIKNLLVHVSNYFPASLKVVYLLKPEGTFQRALEVGFKTILDSCQFPIVLCHTVQELHAVIKPKILTFDLGGHLKYNHLEWVQHRMDIERMRASTQVIAQSLEEFSRCLKNTELANDAETTQIIIDTQRSECDSIKEDFHIAARRGLALLKNIRQAEVKPNAEQLSPTRLHNVTTIERMLIQLEETEKSFGDFWTRHEHRLHQCLQLRRFEDDFRKLQANFAQHMLYLEEHREVGNNVDAVDALISEHKTYMEKSEDSVKAADELKIRGEQLIEIQEKELEGSLRPKCDELQRMKDALTGALQRRLDVLRLSKHMHEQISVANAWCCKGVELLTTLPLDDSCESLKKLEDFLAVGNSLQLDSLRLSKSPDLKTLVLMITTDTSALLQQVSARIADIRKMCESRKGHLQQQKSTDTSRSVKDKPVGAVSPDGHKIQLDVFDTDCSNSPEPKPRLVSKGSFNFEKENIASFDRKFSLPGLNVASLQTQSPVHSFSPCSSNGSGGIAKAAYVIDELITTEQSYVNELNSIIEHYIKPCTNSSSVPSTMGGRQNIIFGNLVDLYQFHCETFLKDLLKTSQESPKQVARCFLEHRAHFYLYVVYCQNKPLSEQVRHEIGECHPFFLECQKNAGHRLPLGAYLLKPVQRITKYQLLLKELGKCSQDAEYRNEIDQAVDCMLDLLQQLNASMHQNHISGYPGDLTNLGQVLLQGRFSVWHSRKQSDKTLRLRRTGKAQQRHLFVYKKVIVFCKHRRHSPPFAQEYYEFKLEIPIRSITVEESFKGNTQKFALCTDGRRDVYTLQPADARIRNEWVLKIKQLVVENFLSAGEVAGNPKYERPISWTSQTSSESSLSSRDLYSNPELVERLSPGDTNNNPPSPRSLPETNNGVDDFAGGDYSDVDCLLISAGEDQFKVRKDYSATTRDEISVKSGETVVLLSKSGVKDWSFVQKLNSSRRGWCPNRYLELE